jgi:pimeloyl-ACP methyl ester carboxylesterase
MSDAPAWFNEAVRTPAESRFAELDGVPVHYLTWNAAETHKPGLLFAHGFRAHARWWSFIAPFFIERFRVAALDFPGMGDSAARPRYDWLDFSRSIRAVLAQSGFGRATLVGHSFGGSHVARAACDFPELVTSAVIVDSYIPVLRTGARLPPQMELRPKNMYPTYEAARARFRLVPEQNSAAPYILDYIARHSLKQVEGGWTWKFDESFLPRQLAPDVEELIATLAGIAVPVAYVYGDRSAVVSAELARQIVKHLRHGTGPIAIASSHHHVLLDQPLALVQTLQELLR